MIQMNTATGLPWRYPSPYANDPTVRSTVWHLSKGELNDEKVEWLAVLAWKSTPWAGRPIPWSEISEERREEQREFAQWALEHAQ